MSRASSRRRAPIGTIVALLIITVWMVLDRIPKANNEPQAPAKAPAQSPDSVPGKVSPDSIKATVDYVQDGDSMIVLLDGEKKTIRLWGVDSPEGNTHQPYAEQAQHFTRELCDHHQVTLIPHDTDRYGRLVAEVVLPDGENVNEELVKAGFAWHYRQHAPDATFLAKAEEEAKAAHRGIWADPDPTPPWKWRREHSAEKN